MSFEVWHTYTGNIGGTRPMHLSDNAKDLIEYGINSFKHLLERGTRISWSEFSELIKDNYAIEQNKKTECIAWVFSLFENWSHLRPGEQRSLVNYIDYHTTSKRLSKKDISNIEHLQELNYVKSFNNAKQ